MKPHPEMPVVAQLVQRLSPEDRRTLLDACCELVPAARDRFERLFGAIGDTTGEDQSAAISTPRQGQIQPGTVIDDYELTSMFDEGCMVVVFIAQQLRPIVRRVAFKLIKPGMDTESVQARFRAKHQALAVLDHPNIVKLLDAGTTEDGNPYYVTEFVQGLPITAYCDQNGLSVEERLKLFVEVCRAVQHVHQKGIVDRDLYPGHILVENRDERPFPRIIDCGILNLDDPQDFRLEDTLSVLVTRHWQYLSPERTELSGSEADALSDVYSLGAILYELMTGTAPIASERLWTASFDQCLNIIRNESPVLPSARLKTLGEKLSRAAELRRATRHSLCKTVSGDIDRIVMKALERDRSRRYPSAASLGDDVERFLGEMPIEAHPRSVLYRIGKFVRRNRRVIVECVACSACAVLATCGLLIASATPTRHAKEFHPRAGRFSPTGSGAMPPRVS